MKISRATQSDIDPIMPIFEAAKRFMRSYGNMEQWNGPYPSRELMLNEIASGHCFVMENDGKIVATFCFIPGEDPTYSYIEGGSWLDDAPYFVIHRLASDQTTRGIARECFDWCFRHTDNLRVDTHRDNIVMQNFLHSYGFTYCGIIYLADGSPRLAYQKHI